MCGHLGSPVPKGRGGEAGREIWADVWYWADVWALGSLIAKAQYAGRREEKLCQMRCTGQLVIKVQGGEAGS